MLCFTSRNRRLKFERLPKPHLDAMVAIGRSVSCRRRHAALSRTTVMNRVRVNPVDREKSRLVALGFICTASAMSWRVICER
ncbi:hypothetical protein C1I98_05945 [Spongiactinospora gelatinilytica]|uniref:Uncharacterized protein n=1 Tax=Spongiactinospora gelatinilytica TaxID=2666298 RepID=A0A2W2HE25_9ACTN|nr:hypothetical protein C1I98_05945 [Spongiactinospora gelatinilytica]